MDATHHGVRRLALVGGGLANTAFLAALAEHVDRVAGTGGPVPRLDVVVFDRGGEFGGGTAYGRHNSPALLLNTIAAEVGTPELGFRDWLRRNPGRWRDPLLRSADPRVARWASTHRADLEHDRWDGLFLPRAVFGDFLRARMRADGRRLHRTSAGAMRLRTVAGEVTRIHREPAGSLVLTTGGTTAGGSTAHRADAVVLGLGGQAGRLAPDLTGRPGYLTDIHHVPLEVWEGRLRAVLAATPPGRRRLVVAGSAHTAVELLYCLSGWADADDLVDEIVVVSTNPELPDGRPSARRSGFTLPRLAAAHRQPGLTADALLAAVAGDVRAAKLRGFAMFDHLHDVQDAFLGAFARLPPREKRAFVERHGGRYTAIIRWTSTDYALALRRLVDRRRLRVVEGTVTDVRPGARDRFAVVFDSPSGRRVLDAAAVADCAGFVGPARSHNPLLRNLLDDGAVAVNPSGRGLVVNERFEALPAVFVHGALLVGLSRGDDHFWHFDSTDRITLFAGRLLAAVWDTVTRP